MQVVQVGQHILVLLEQELASKVEILKDGVLVADTYFVRDLNRRGKKLSLKTQMRNGSENHFRLIGDRSIKSVKVDGKPCRASGTKKSRQHQFDCTLPEQQPLSFAWTGNWKVKTDLEESLPAYDDSDWRVLDKPISLEEAGLLRHGYIWYRGEFNVPGDVTEATLNLPGNDTDRMIIYINGQQVWFGITEKKMVETGIQHVLKPGRNTVAVLYENFYHNKSHPHEGDILKYSGIMKPIEITGMRKGKSWRRRIHKLKVREQLTGDLKGYANLKYRDASWMTLDPAHKYVMDMDLGDILWMRRTFTYACKKGWECGVKLTIPDAKDRCIIYLNGRPLGQYEHIGPQHEFYVPASYLQKENVLAIVLEGSKTFMDVCRGFLLEPVFGSFYEVKDVPVTIEFN
jgi:hypothetical protein